MFAENELSGAELAAEIRNLLNEPEMLNQMSVRMKGMGKPEATDTIIKDCLKLIEQ